MLFYKKQFMWLDLTEYLDFADLYLALDGA